MFFCKCETHPPVQQRCLVGGNSRDKYGGAARDVPRQFQRAVHRVRKVFPEGREEQRAIVAHPKVARALDKVVDAVSTRLERVGRVEVLVSEPLVVSRTLRAACQTCVGLDA